MHNFLENRDVRHRKLALEPDLERVLGDNHRLRAKVERQKEILLANKEALEEAQYRSHLMVHLINPYLQVYQRNLERTIAIKGPVTEIGVLVDTLKELARAAVANNKCNRNAFVRIPN